MKKILCGITKNFSFLLIGQIVYKIFTFFTYALIARYLNVSGFGQFSFAISFIGLFAIGIDFGLSELLIKDVAGSLEEMSQKYINSIISIKLILAVVVYFFIILIGSLIIKIQNLKSLVLIIGLCLVLDSFTMFFRSIYRLFEKMEFEAISLITEAILKLGFVYVALRFFTIDVLHVAYALVAVSLVSLVFTSLFYSPKFRFDFNYIFSKVLFRKALPFAFLAFFGVVNFKIAVVMISWLSGDRLSGWYSASIRLIEPILIIPTMAAIALFPTISKIYKTSQNNAIILYKNTLKIFFLISIPGVLIVNMFAKKIVMLVFGEAYLSSIFLLHILTFSLLAFFIKFLLERVILILNKPKIVITSYIYGTLIMVAGSILLTKIIGHGGTAIALVISEFFIVGYNLFSIRLETQNLKI